MNFKNIDWDHVTRFSQLIAIVLFVAVLAAGFFLGKTYEYHAFVNGTGAALSQPATSLGTKPISDTTYACNDKKTVRAIYRTKEVELLLSDGRHLTVPQAISGSGVRYANADESFVFWNKGNTAFVTEGIGARQTTTFANCSVKPILE